MRITLLALFLACHFGTEAQAAGRETSANLNPRFENIWGQPSDWARRGFLKTQVLVKQGDLGFNLESFIEHDLAQTTLEPNGAPDARKSRSVAALQEAYVDAQWGPIFFRAGRQPVRWSQSWTLPSLDVFTGRRWNRLFVDPVSEQLTHPDGVLVSYGGSIIEADLFEVIQTAENNYPSPLGNVDRALRDQTGLRLKTRVGGFDLSVVAHRRPEDGLLGGSVSYALDCCVLKTEVGARGTSSNFALIGIDYFGDFLGIDTTLGPQITAYHDTLITKDDVEAVMYLPLRLSRGKNAIEFQYYKVDRVRDMFSSLLVSRELSDYKNTSVKLSVFNQNYLGQTGRLFSIYENLTGTSVTGLRLDLNKSL